MALTFTDEARAAATAWKKNTALLPEDARADGPVRSGVRTYSHCLPRQFAELNLLPDARDGLESFARAGIPWHDEIDGGPSNHLLDSQVQCVNALAPFIANPDGLRALFSETLPIATVLPFGDPVAPDDFVVFEWIGHDDPLGEWQTALGSRGTMNSSADAAIKYRNYDGELEIAIIEWKYTETYPPVPPQPRDAERRTRYQALYDDPDGPIRHDGIPYEDFFVEPIYQLLRLQLLAHQMERAGDADRVRLMYCAPARNGSLWSDLNRDSHRQAFPQLGISDRVPDVGSLWQLLQRRPDRFALYDTAGLASSASPLSDDFKQRYGHLADPVEDPTVPNPFVPGRAQSSIAIGRLRDAIGNATSIYERVFASGSVLEQIEQLPDEQLSQLPIGLSLELAARLEELGNLAKHSRAEEAYEILAGIWDDHG